MERVLVIGSGGAGKSTFAKRLAERLGLPLVHLDAIYWRDGWIETPKEEWRGIVARLIGEPRWVMDGNYGGTMDVRLAAADTVIFLDMPRVVCLWRVVKRYFQFRGHAHPGTPAGNPARLSWEFVWWIWTYPTRRRPAILERLRKLPDKRVVVLSSQAEADRFMRDLGGV
jgi:adenylate kinase family enzyme